MFVNDLPSGTLSMETYGLAHPEADRPPRQLGSSSHLQKAMAKREIAFHCEVEIARLELNRPLPRVKPRLFFLQVHSMMDKRRRETKDNCIRRVGCNNSSGILTVVRFVTRLEDVANVGFIRFRLDLHRCSCHDVSSSCWFVQK